jgi:DNA-binding CsgD family transcriptional regulator
MKTFLKALKQRAREIIYLLASFPISVILFCFVIFAFSSSLFLPLSVLLFLFLLTSMEKIAKFEIARTNKILKTDFPVVENWFSKPFFSWEGAKERVTSLRSWLAIGYVFVSFGWSIFSFVLVVFGLSGSLLILLVLGVIALSNINHSFAYVDGGDRFAGNISFDNLTGKIRLQFGDGMDSAGISWNLDSYWNLGAGFLLLILAIWIIPRNTRAMANMVDSLLSGKVLPEAQARLKRFQKSSKVSERQIREAMDQEVLQPQISELSKREREILALMAQGKSNAGIAKSLYLTEGAVEKHISSILSKLELGVEEDSHRRVLAVLKYLGINNSNS